MYIAATDVKVTQYSIQLEHSIRKNRPGQLNQVNEARGKNVKFAIRI